MQIRIHQITKKNFCLAKKTIQRISQSKEQKDTKRVRIPNISKNQEPCGDCHRLCTNRARPWPAVAAACEGHKSIKAQ